MESYEWRPLVRRAAAIELAALATLGVVAAVAFWSGTLVSCTTLTCYGAYLTTRMIPSAALFKRLRGDALGIAARPRDERIERFLTIAGSGLLAFYAVANAALDLFEPRLDDDPLSLPGIAAALCAFALVALILASQRPLGTRLATPAMRASRTSASSSAAVTAVVVVALLLHVFIPEWWIDTTVDLGFAALAGATIRAALAQPGAARQVS